jgi:chromosome partitioning protein
MSGKVVAFCNRKGGVGKTTSTISIADTLQSQFGASVAVVDTDPQASSSLALARDDMLNGSLAAKFLERTLAGNALDGRRIALDDCIRRAVGRLTDRPDVPLSLVPISPAFWRFEIRVRREVAFFATTRTVAVRRFRRLIHELKDQYDFVLIDTAPGVSLLFDHIVRESDYLVVPCVPDEVSVWGLKLLAEELQGMRGRPAPPARILWTQYNPNSAWQEKVRHDLAPLPFEFFTRTGAGPGESSEILGVGQYVGLPSAIANVEPRSWSALYSGQLGANLLRICEDLVKLVDGVAQ